MPETTSLNQSTIESSQYTSHITIDDDVLDELMGLKRTTTANVLNSSAYLDELIYKASLKDHENEGADKECLITFMKDTLETVKETVDSMVNNTIDFLKEELTEKNLLIRTLILKNANDYDPIDINLLEKSLPNIFDTPQDHNSTPELITYSSQGEPIPAKANNRSNQITLVDYEDSDDEIYEESENDFDADDEEENDSDDVKYRCNTKMLNSTPTSYGGFNASVTTSSSAATENARYKYSERYPWEKFSSGVASKILDRMGYHGKGLGKNENGITDHIMNDSNRFKTETSSKQKMLYILSDSMFNGIDGKRLSNERYEVKVEYHGGCTIQRMYSHLDNVLQSKPEVLVLNVGTNNCTNNTSDEVLSALIRLKNYIQKLLPSTIIYISTPTIRLDNSRANCIIRNLNVKLKKAGFKLLNNVNITERDLGKKGLHFNIHGKRKMASNIISLIKHL